MLKLFCQPVETVVDLTLSMMAAIEVKRKFN